MTFKFIRIILAKIRKYVQSKAHKPKYTSWYQDQKKKHILFKAFAILRLQKIQNMLDGG